MKSLLFPLFIVPSLAFSAPKFSSPSKIITSGSMTGTTTLTSKVVDTRDFDNIALQANYTGTGSGTFYVDVCEDWDGSSGNWTTLGQTLTAPSGSTGTSYMDVNQTGAAYLRVRYTNASGSGTLDLYFGAKSL